MDLSAARNIVLALSMSTMSKSLLRQQSPSYLDIRTSSQAFVAAQTGMAHGPSESRWRWSDEDHQYCANVDHLAKKRSFMLKDYVRIHLIGLTSTGKLAQLVVILYGVAP